MQNLVEFFSWLGQISKKEKQPDIYRIELDRIEKRISEGLGTKVKISHGAKKGKIEIEYYGNTDLERLLSLFKI